jgi:holin-like protein
MIVGFAVLLLCQLLGGFIVQLFGLPIPGPVVGMVLLFVVLRLRRPDQRAGVVRAADLLLRHLQLLFVPAGVGVIAYFSVIAEEWLPIVGGMVLSWLAVLVITGGAGVGVLQVESWYRRRRPPAAKSAQ